MGPGISFPNKSNVERGHSSVIISNMWSFDNFTTDYAIDVFILSSLYLCSCMFNIFDLQTFTTCKFMATSFF